MDIIAKVRQSYGEVDAELRSAKTALDEAKATLRSVERKANELIRKTIIEDPEICKLTVYCKRHRYSGTIEKVYFSYKEAKQESEDQGGYNESPYFTTHIVQDCAADKNLMYAVLEHIFECLGK